MRMARVLKLAVSSLFVLPGLMLAPVTGWAELDYHALLAPPNAAWAKQDPLVPSDEWVITGVVFFSFRECQTFRLQKVERLRAMLPELPRKPRMGGDRRAALAEMADLDAAKAALYDFLIAEASRCIDVDQLSSLRPTPWQLLLRIDTGWWSIGAYPSPSACAAARSETVRRYETAAMCVDAEDPRGIKNKASAPSGKAAPAQAGPSLAELDALFDGPKALDEGKVVIPFTPGRPIYVEARVNGRVPARLVLDTGADSTMIAPRLLRAAGATVMGRTTLLGVAGQATVGVYKLVSLEVGQAKISPLNVLAHDPADSAADGLLGRDFLGMFTMTLDNDAGLVVLIPLRDRQGPQPLTVPQQTTPAETKEPYFPASSIPLQQQPSEPPSTATFCPGKTFWNGRGCTSAPPPTPKPTSTTISCPGKTFWNGYGCTSK